ncbi:hypothetical protein [Nocardia sp. NPDC004722]
MRTTMSDSPPRVPRRLTIALMGIVTGVATLSGCSSSSSPAPATTSPATTVVTPTSLAPTAVSATAAPAPTGTGGAQPRTLMPHPPVETPPVLPPVLTSPGAPVTPVPSTPQANPPSGTTFAGEGLTDAQANAEQQAVDSGHQPWRLDTVMVAKAFVQGRFGWTTVQTSTGAPMVVFVTNSDGSKVTLHLIQPATKGDKGIWEVDSGVWD